MTDDEAPITELLRLVNAGDEVAESQLLTLLYAELRRLAVACMTSERKDHTLQPTALVHEAYIRLAAQKDKPWENRNHFFAVAAQVMRRVLVDYARAKKSQKRGGAAIRIEMEENLITTGTGWQERVIDVDRALSKLAGFDPRLAKIVELRFFGGLTEIEAGEVMGISSRTVKRQCKAARAWLYGELRGGEARSDSGEAAGAAFGAASGES